MASNEPTREALLEENERLPAENERLQAMLGQDTNEKTEQENISEEERPRKKQKTTQHGEHELVPRRGNEGRTDAGSGQSGVDGDQQAAADDILILPNDLLGRVLDFLEFSERRDFFVGNHKLWKHVRVEYETQIMCDLILDQAPRLGLLGQDFTSVFRLNFGRHCSDTALAVLCHKRAFPQLAHLAMAGSTNVTDNGLRLLTENSNRRQKLETLNIAFCPHTTIEAAFLLQRRLINLRVVRRQPEWMDGVALYKGGTRIHYWADGTSAQYDSDGEMKNCTYSRNLFKEGSGHHLVSKQQVVFVENELWKSRPAWFRHALRPGVSFLNRPNTHSVMRTETAIRAGTFPVQGFPRPEEIHLIPMNSTRVFNRQGELCQRNDPNKYVQVWHLQLQPLSALMPPQDVVDRIRNHVGREKVVMAGRNQEQDERNVHVRYGGNQNDVPPEYWFQYGN